MSRTFDSNVSNFLRNGNTVVSGYPYSMGCWFNTSDVTNNQMLIGFADGSDDPYYQGIMAAGTASNSLKVIARNGGGEFNAQTSTSYSADTWHHALGTFDIATRWVYLDGAGAVENTTSVAFAAQLDRTSIGKLDRLSDIIPHGGLIAEAAIWKIKLTPSNALELAAGYSPLLVRPDALVSYWPLYGNIDPEPDLVGGFNQTVNGTVAKGVPTRVIMPASPMIGHNSGGAVPSTILPFLINRDGLQVHSAGIR